MNLKCLLCGIAILVCVGTVKAIDNVSERVSASISLKVPGNEAKQYPLTFQKTTKALISWKPLKEFR